MPWSTAAGPRLYYENQGAGNPPLLFVHGGLCDSGHFAPQIEHFAPAHRVVAPDLRGHGRSRAAAPPYTVATFAADLAALCREIDLARPVVVGHSLGGLVALELAAREPALPAAVVLLDAPAVPPPGHAERTGQLLAALRSPAYTEVVTAWARRMAHPDAGEADAAQLAAGMAATPRAVAVAAVESMLTYDSDAAAAACTVPVLAIDGQSDLARFRALCPHLITGQTVGGGHFIQLDVPVQVNDMIAQFLRMIAADASAER